MGKVATSILWTVLILGALVGLARLTALRWWQIPRDEDDPTLAVSLTPTLWGGDWVILWRLTSPKHGDIVKCQHPSEPGFVIGRLVGAEGERIKVHGSSLSINERFQQTERACSDVTFGVTGPGMADETLQPCSLEVVAGQSHMTGRVPGDANAMSPRELELTAGPGEAVLVSDNRLFPYDSRDYGPVEAETCTETVMFRLVSQEGFGDSKNRLDLIH